ncbi:MAG: radical SAM protein [Candidatus Schekmanbacteria bacterium]|nr:radical SAM protein [Candidatus Schekmanbacteria bacterium]
MNLRRNFPYYMWRTFNWHVLKDHSPIVASLKLTQRCNLRCTHCPWLVTRTKELTTVEWKHKIDKLWQRGCTVVVIEGGEPTLRTDLGEIIDYCRSIGFFIILVTNGTLDIEPYHPDVLWISIEGTQPIHDSIRGAGMFQKSFDTIKKYQGKKHIVTLTTLSKKNVGDIENLLATLSPHLDGMWFSYAYPYHNIQDEILSQEEKIESARLIMSLRPQYPNIYNSDTFLKEVGCGWKCYPWLMIVVTSDGFDKDGCMIEHIEKNTCRNCDLGCNGELSKLFEVSPDTRNLWRKNVGTPITLELFGRQIW